MEQDSVVSLRLASTDDVETILEISEGIYDGADYIPLVLHQWLNDKRRMVFLAEYDGNVIGMCVATISENHESFVGQSIRLHPSHRRKNLGYKLHKAVIDKVCTMYPHVSKMFVMCDKHLASYTMCLRIGFTPIMEQTYHIVQKLSWKNINITSADLPGSQLVSWNNNNVVHLYKNKKLLDLVGLHGFIVVDKGFPHQLPQDAHLVANEVDQVFVDVPVHKIREQDGFPRSFSHGALSKRVSKHTWKCHIFTDDPEIFKKHVRCQLNAAVRYFDDKELAIHFYQSSCSKFDGCKVIKDQLSRLKLNGDVTTNVAVLLQHNVYKNPAANVRSSIKSPWLRFGILNFAKRFGSFFK